MNKDDYFKHDCFIALMFAIISILAALILCFVEFEIDVKSSMLLEFVFGIFLAVMMLLLLGRFIKFCFLENKYKFYVLNNETIKDKALVNSQKRIAVDMDITKIPPRYFSGNKILEKIEFYVGENSYLVIGDSAFFACSNLNTLEIHGGTTVAKPNAFSGCKKLKNLVLETKIDGFNQNVFSSCESLKEISLPVNLDKIDNAMLSQYKKIASVTIPSSVTSIGSDAFSGCKKIKEVVFHVNKDKLKEIYPSFDELPKKCVIKTSDCKEISIKKFKEETK